MDNVHKLNSILDLWGFYPEAGKHLPYWHPNGAAIRNAIEEFWKREHFKQGYSIVYTPHIGAKSLWETSGHTDRFAEKMYPTIRMDASNQYILRPMNCPFHIKIYQSEKRSYRDLPLRFAELGTVYRRIPSGSFKEMFEVRGFTQDDAHIFCEPTRAKEEIANIIEFTIFFLRDVFKIEDFKIIRRLKPIGGIGNDTSWNQAQKILKDVLTQKKLPYRDEPGEGVFYGPKIDFEIADPIYDKNWICSTIQLDIVLPERFDVRYTTKNTDERTPLMIHRTILGSLERFIALLVSRTQGNLPLWISPIQVIIIPIGAVAFQSNLDFARKTKSILESKLSDLMPRIKLTEEAQDIRAAKQEAIENKIPYLVFIGSNERIAEKLSVTHRESKGYTEEPRQLTVDELASELRDKIQKRL